MFGARADAITNIMNPSIVAMYTGFLPNSSEKGPATRPPQPKAIKNRAVARDSVTSETPNSSAACSRAPESMDEEKPTIHPIAPTFILCVQKFSKVLKAQTAKAYTIHILLAYDHLCGFKGSFSPLNPTTNTCRSPPPSFVVAFRTSTPVIARPTVVR